jgi:hypothetical protein
LHSHLRKKFIKSRFRLDTYTWRAVSFLGRQGLGDPPYLFESSGFPHEMMQMTSAPEQTEAQTKRR